MLCGRCIVNCCFYYFGIVGMNFSWDVGLYLFSGVVSIIDGRWLKGGMALWRVGEREFFSMYVFFVQFFSIVW